MPVAKSIHHMGRGGKNANAFPVSARMALGRPYLPRCWLEIGVRHQGPAEAPG